MNPGLDGGFHNQVVGILRDVAATAIVPRFKRLAPEDVRTKAHKGDIVTVADEEAEHLLSEKLPALVPGSRLIGEEGVAKDPSLLILLSEDAPVWVVDPLDGTTNFVNGIERFAMMVALVRGGETVMGWIHAPLTKKTLMAERGAGTWELDSAMRTTRHQIPDTPMDLPSMTVALHHRAFWEHTGKFRRNLRHGCAAFDYWALVAGDLQLITYRRLKPWDHAPGVLIYKEAGGFVRLLNGSDYRPGNGEQEGLLCTPTAETWESVAALVK